VERARAVLDTWEQESPDRLSVLVALLKELEILTGSSLPLPLPRDI
jgi:hypothetical protein